MDRDVFQACSFAGGMKCIGSYRFTWDNGEYLDDEIQLKFIKNGVQTRDNATFGCTVHGRHEKKNDGVIWGLM